MSDTNPNATTWQGYPQFIAAFRKVYDQPISPDLDWSGYTDEIYTEIVAIENVIGAAPFLGLPYTTLNQALTDLFLNKSSRNHSHFHAELAEDNSPGSHPQYMDAAGVNPILAPITAPGAWNPNQLVTLGQVTGSNFVTLASSFLDQMIAQEFVQTVQSFATGFRGPDAAHAQSGMVVTGGYTYGVTDSSGNIHCSFGGAFHSSVDSLTIMRMPGQPNLSMPAYNFREDLLIPLSWDNTGATIKYIDDALANKERSVAFSFIAMGV